MTKRTLFTRSLTACSFSGTTARLCKVLAAMCMMGTMLFAWGCAGTTPPAPPVVPAPASHKVATAKKIVSSPHGSDVVETARSLLGIPYKWGGKSPQTGFDCSGFVWYVYHQNGVELPRTTAQMLTHGRPVNSSALRPGDLIFYNVVKKGKTYHVGIVTESGTFVHSPSSGKGVSESQIASQFWKTHYIGARRVF